MATIHSMNPTERATLVRTAVAGAVAEGYGDLDNYIPEAGSDREYDWNDYGFVPNDPTLIDFIGEVSGEYDEDEDEEGESTRARLRVQVVEIEVDDTLYNFRELSDGGPKNNADKREEIAQAMNDLADSLTDDMTIDQAYKKINALAERVRSWE